MNIQPLSDQVLIQLIVPASTTESGIHIPVKAQNADPTCWATVVAVGPGRSVDGIRQPMSVHPGDEVLWVKGQGLPVRDDTRPNLVLTAEGDLRAVRRQDRDLVAEVDGLLS